MLVSFVIPAYNEQDTILTLTQQIKAECAKLKISADIIYIDDGSTDGTWERIREVSHNQRDVCGVRLRRNFGKSAALAAGFAKVRGEFVVTMDADLQDDPADIAKMIAALQDGYDLVTGWRVNRRDPLSKRIPSAIFNSVVRFFTRVSLHDQNCGFKAMRQGVATQLNLYGEMHRYIPVLVAGQGYKVGEVPVTHHPRKFGVSKYGTKRLVIGLLDFITVYTLTGYRYRPLHLMGTIGLAAFSIGALGMTYLACLWLLGMGPIGTRPLLVYSVAVMILGCHIFATGILAEFITASQTKRGANFDVRDQTGSLQPQAAQLLTAK